MKTLVALATLALAVPALAQSPLTTLLGGTNQANQGSQMFFDLTVNTTVTIQALDVNLSSAPGVIGTIEVYTTVPGITTYVGNTAAPALWSALPVATGQVVAAGANQYSHVCLSTGIVLPPGSIGVALRHVECQPWYTNQPASSFSTAELTLSAGAVQGVPWGALTQPRIWNGRIHYALGSVAHACASNTRYGPGCYQQQQSFYQFFSNAPSAAAALSGRAISFLANNPGYSVVSAPAHPWVAPSATATAFVADDAEFAWTWPSGTPFGPGGPTTIYVHSNGIVSLAPQTGLTPSSYRPNVPAFLNAGATAFWSWHDFVATAAGSGAIKLEEVAGVLYVTWDGVESYAAAANPSWLQFQLVLATGDVHLVWQSITALGTSLYGDSHVVGFSPGGPSMDPGPTDVATFTSVALGTSDVAPLTLNASPRPALGSTVTWATTNPPTIGGIGLHFLSVADLPPFSPAGLDLGVIGAGGCVANVDIAQGYGSLISNLGGAFPGMDVALAIPVNLGLLGTPLYGQSVWFDAAANAAGLVTSNAVQSVIGTW
ncbi:MAG: hypothetical protein JNK15_07355 [Planctomycetes bacterium]|nr:hypothetical protein [Planctomycetota bacterium]